jgi:uncharacterized protein YndB with AHSA1/START domain
LKRTIVIERLLPHSRERVWKALTDRAILGKWFMETDFEPEVGRAFTFRMKPQRGWDGVTHCEVIDLRPEQSIAYTYRGTATGEKAIACAGVKSDSVKSVGKGFMTELDTVLRFTLTEKDGRTHLRMEHSGFVGLKLVLVSFIMEMGWKRSVLPRLERLLT